MKSVTSGNFLQEFTLLANEVTAEGERLIIQRPQGEPLVLLSLAEYNELMKKIYRRERA